MTRRNADALKFGLFGVATFVIILWVQLSWLQIAAFLMPRWTPQDRPFVDGSNPAIFRAGSVRD
jgi:hypothetical protein